MPQRPFPQPRARLLLHPLASLLILTAGVPICWRLGMADALADGDEIIEGMTNAYAAPAT